MQAHDPIVRLVTAARGSLAGSIELGSAVRADWGGARVWRRVPEMGAKGPWLGDTKAQKGKKILRRGTVEAV